MAPDRTAYAERLAFMTARRFRRPDLHNVDAGDLEGAALLGAAKALARFDESRGIPFQTYAISLIRGEIREELRRWDFLTRPGRQKARAELFATGALPEWALPPLAIEDLRVEELPDPHPGPEEAALECAQCETWQRLIDLPPAREAAVLRSHYFAGRTFRQIATAQGYSETRAQQLCCQAHRRLRKMAEEEV